MKQRCCCPALSILQIITITYVPGFEQDIFISYAQVDNQQLDINGREVCWASHLKEQLQRRVDQKLGRKNATTSGWISKIWLAMNP